MNTYTVTSATYCGSIAPSQNLSDNNPIVVISITRNGQKTGVNIYWDQVQAASQAGLPVLQQLLAYYSDSYWAWRTGTDIFNYTVPNNPDSDKYPAARHRCPRKRTQRLNQKHDLHAGDCRWDLVDIILNA